MAAELNIDKFEEFIAQYPIFEYRVLKTEELSVEDRVRIVCQQECERYGSTWACPPAVGTLKECEDRIRGYSQAVFFSSVAEVSDIMNMPEMLATRAAHEELTTAVAGFLRENQIVPPITTHKTGFLKCAVRSNTLRDIGAFGELCAE